VGLAGPLGLLPEGALSFERVHAIASNPLGRLVLLGLIALPLWRGAHQIRFLLVEWLGAEADGVVGPLLYAVAAVGSLAGIAAVLSL
jgi:fumarate reductase subunit D